MKQEDVGTCRALAAQYISTRGGGEVGEELGSGGSAAVFRWEGASPIRALKVYDPKFLNGPAASAERFRLCLQRRFIGQHCPSLIDTFVVEEAHGTCFVEMEFFRGSELKQVIAAVPEDSIGPLIGQLVAAVQFMDSLGIVHRDIKPENILVSDDFKVMKLLDLGIIRESTNLDDRVDGTDHGEKRPFIATAQYSSPEYLFRLEAPSPSLWRALSIYQVGGVLHDLVCRRPLFQSAVAADNKYALAMAVMKDPPDFSGVPAHLTSWAALAARCLAKDSRVRLQSVDWGDFSFSPEMPTERLRRALASRTAQAIQAEKVQARTVTLERERNDALENLVKGFKLHLLAEFAQQLRITVLDGKVHRKTLLLTFDACVLDLQVELECQWEASIQEETGKITLAAVAVEKQVKGFAGEISGQRRFVGELTVGADSRLISTALVEAVSKLAVMHIDLVDSVRAIAGVDLVAVCWPQKPPKVPHEGGDDER